MWKRDPLRAELSEQIERLTTEVAKLTGEARGRKESIRLTDTVKDLKRQITDLEISKAKREEENERKLREVEHKVGLEKLRGESEREIAVKEAKLAVREENLGRERESFEKEMEFTRTRMGEEVDRLADLQKEILERLPVVKVDRQIREHVGTAVNGNGDSDDE